MGTKLTLLATAAVLTCGLSMAAVAADAPGAPGNIRMAAESDSGAAPGGSGYEQSEAGRADTQKNSSSMAPSTGAGSMSQGGAMNSEDQGGTGVKASSESMGANNKESGTAAGTPPNAGGANSANAPGGTGVEKSSTGEGTGNKSGQE